MKINKEEGVFSGTLTNSTGEYALNDLSIDPNGALRAGLNYQGYSIELCASMYGTLITGKNEVQGRTFEFAGRKAE